MDQRERPAALPLWALVVAVAGLCLPPLLLVAAVLAIISLARGDNPAYAARRVMAIVALVLSVLTVPVVGILAAIAIPNFIKFQARAKQSACKSVLKETLAAERAFKEKTGRFTTFPAELELGALPRVPPLLLRLDGIGPLGAPADLAPAAVGLLTPGPGGEALDEGLPDEVRAQLGVRGTCPDCSVTLACAANVDQDPGLDVWSISSGPRPRPGGAPVAAGELFVHLDDVLDEAHPLPPFGLTGPVAPRVAGGTVAAAAPQAEPPAPDDADPRQWQTYSFDGRTGLKQSPVGDRCLLTCTREDGSRLWELVGGCQSTRGERRFLAPDGERLVVLVPAPPRGKAWSATEVMRVYQRGSLAYQVMGTTVLPEQAMAASTTWLQGCFGAPGVEPHYSADGYFVEYTTIAGLAGRVPLKAEGPPDAGVPARKKKPGKKR